MGMDRRKYILILSAGASPVQQLIGLFGLSSIIEIWPLDEISGTVARGVVNGLNGAYTGVDLANAGSRVPGASSPYFDGVNDYVDIYSASLNAAFNGAAGTMGILGRVADAAVWSDGAQRVLIQTAVDTTTNRHRMQRIASNNDIYTAVIAGGVTAPVAHTTTGPLDFVYYAFTWDANLRYYYNGAATGATPAITGTYAGALSNTLCYLGSAGASARWKGWLSYAYILNRVATPAEQAKANKILGGA